MRADNQREGTFFRELFRLSHFAEETEPRYDEIINGKEHDDQLEWDHHYIVIKMHLDLCTLSFPILLSQILILLLQTTYNTLHLSHRQ